METLVTVDPSLADICWCNYDLGQGLSSDDCSIAARQLSAEDMPTPHSVGLLNRHPYWNTSANDLPYRTSHGQCEVWVEVVGGGENVNYHNQQVNIIPSRIRGLAGYVIDQCVETRLLGGYVTDGLASMVDYIQQWPKDISTLATFPSDLQPFPVDARFITVTVKGLGDGPPETPNKDDDIPLQLSEELRSRLPSGDEDLRDRMLHFIVEAVKATNLETASSLMNQGDISNWWDPFRPSWVTFECDSSLGSPAISDCTQLEYSGLSPPSDTLIIGPGATKFLSSNTCQVIISASIEIVITWNQVKSALQNLISTCISSTMHPAWGGRAFYNSEVAAMASKLTGRREKTALVTAIEVLPPHVNVTISGR